MDDMKLARPSSPLTKSIARVFVDGCEVRAYFPENRKEFREVVYSLSMAWKRPYYVRTAKDKEAAFNLSAELANSLLRAGFVVKAPSQAVDAAISGDFEPEPRYGVRVGDIEPFGDCFVVWWRSGEDLYHAAKSLPGARYARPYVAVPPDSFAAVRDFIDTYQCHATSEVWQLIDAAEAEFESAVVVEIESPRPVRGTTPEWQSTPPLLEVPDHVDIDEDLIDEEE